MNELCSHEYLRRIYVSFCKGHIKNLVIGGITDSEKYGREFFQFSEVESDEMQQEVLDFIVNHHEGYKK